MLWQKLGSLFIIQAQFRSVTLRLVTIYKEQGKPGMRIDAFIVLRCTRTREQFIVFLNLIKSISFHYPEAKRIVIDDHSSFVDESSMESSYDHLLIHSEFTPGSGEVLPYFYFHKLGVELGIETACILHDSVILNRAFDVPDGINFAPLWNFKIKGKYQFPPFVAESEVFNSATYVGNGCFGGMCILKWHFLHARVTKEALRCLCRKITHRGQRMVIERLIAAIFADEHNVCSLFGNIGNHPHAWKCSPELVALMSTSDLSRYPVMKLWFGR